MSHYIYLLQTREFINAKKPIYKLGKTTMENMKRFKQYARGYCVLFQMICKNCHTCEKDLIIIFKTKYGHKTEYGTEYFEGNYIDMITDIYTYIINEPIEEQYYLPEYDITYIENILKPKTKADKYNKKANKKINAVFPLYLNDTIYGGQSKYIKVNINTDNIIIAYIAGGHEWHKNCERKYAKYVLIYGHGNCIMTYEFNISDEDINNKYMLKLIKKKILEHDKIYDLNDAKFITKINKCKTRVVITLSSYHKFYDNLITEPIIRNDERYITTEKVVNSRLDRIFKTDIIINKKFYCYKHICEIGTKRIYYICSDIEIINGLNKYSFMCVIINKIMYENLYLREYLPYKIYYTNTHFYMKNRNQLYIGSNSYETPPDVKIEHFTEIYLYKGPHPTNHADLIDLITKYNEIVQDKICLNMNDHTQSLFGIKT